MSLVVVTVVVIRVVVVQLLRLICCCWLAATCCKLPSSPVLCSHAVDGSWRRLVLVLLLLLLLLMLVLLLLLHRHLAPPLKRPLTLAAPASTTTQVIRLRYLPRTPR